MYTQKISIKLVEFQQNYESFYVVWNSQGAKSPSPLPHGNGHISRLSTSYIIGNKQICKMQVVSFNLIPKSLCPVGGAMKIIFSGLGSWTNKNVFYRAFLFLG